MKKSLLLFSFHDISANIRLLHHAKSFASLENSQVIILAPDISSMPKEIEKMINVKHYYLYQFVELPQFMLFFLTPIKILYYLLQLFIIMMSLQNFDFIITSNEESHILSYFLAKWCHSKLIFDYSSLKWNKYDYKLIFMRRFEEILLKLADYHICSTKAIQFILKIRKINAFVIHDPKNPVFQNTKSIKNAKKDDSSINKSDNEKFEVYNLIGINQKMDIQIINENGRIFDDSYFLIGIPFPIFSISNLKSLLTIGKALDKQNAKACFIIFVSPKIEKEITKEISKFHFSHIIFQIFLLNSDAYAFILRNCDFGIIFNTSHYGLEYSHELSDLLACKLPILALKHGCVSEAVKEGVNGFIFENDIQLAKYLNSILIAKNVDLEKMKDSYNSNHQNWTQEWEIFFQEFY
ncbi:hypothetical protein TRFO_17778 [Tritrichomonas foetus]|uniref:Glycosyl transferase family 1 domain-containing protein n=1 Tax=Tritrichomonas foetus TaxID=1144522 RepID=A0A1J4KRG4_9EUKA|nr:hypothetical protein TRFO_17778 [Tritrichomonas foetus]|eukprot:OHT12404.1 hypothetical protein TRFO_17778 [Tritrichomonas foetus]